MAGMSPASASQPAREPFLSREVMLARMLSADPAYDGQFITGVVTTGIYCLPSCRARKPRPENVVFYRTPAQARAVGLRACLRCQPDHFYAGADVQENSLLEVLKALDLTTIPDTLALARRVRVSSSQLSVLFRHYLHRTPGDWLAGERVRTARWQLLHTPDSVAEIAFQSGFESLSAFNAQFRRRCGLTPLALRQMATGGTLTLSLPQGFNVALLLADLGRDPQQTSLRVEGQRVSAALTLAHGPRTLFLTFQAAQVQGQLDGSFPLHPAEALSVHEQTLRLLGWRSETRRLEARQASTPDLARLLQHRLGTRLPLTPDPFDALVWAVLGQQVSFRTACLFRRRLSEYIHPPLDSGLYPPPQASLIARLSTSEAQHLGLTPSRAELLLRVAGLVHSGELDLPALAAGSAPQANRQLLAIPGIGPWTAAYVLLRGLGFQDVVPPGDSALASALQRFFGLPERPDARQTAELLRPFAPHRSLVTFHLWHQLAAQETS